MLKRHLAALLVAAAALTFQIAGPRADTLSQSEMAERYEQSQANKAMVTKAYQALFGDHDLKALDLYWSDDYIQHNPYMGDGKKGVSDFMTKMGYLNGPKSKVEFLRVIAEGDLVMIQTRSPAYGGNPEMVIGDIFRVENGKIAEHWDIMHAVPADKTNPRPMY